MTVVSGLHPLAKILLFVFAAGILILLQTQIGQMVGGVLDQTKRTAKRG